MNNEMVDNAVAAIGAVAEIAGVMLTQLQNNGFERSEAVEICGKLVCQTLSGKSEKEGNADDPT